MSHLEECAILVIDNNTLTSEISSSPLTEESDRNWKESENLSGGVSGGVHGGEQGGLRGELGVDELPTLGTLLISDSNLISLSEVCATCCIFS